MGVSGVGFPLLSNFPSLIKNYFYLDLGPNFHLLGYVSLSIITLLVFATKPWSHVDISDDVN